MELRTLVRNCLYLNWALPVRWLPEPPRPLHYDRQPWQGEDHAFVSLLLFRQQGLHLTSLPLPRLSYPQCNFRFNTRGGDAAPSVLFTSLLVPYWVVPGARWIGRQPAAAARFDYPAPTRDGGGNRWRWVVRQGAHRFVVRAHPDDPVPPTRPSLGGWEETVRYFRVRPVGYSLLAGRLQRIQTSHPGVAVCPVRAEVEEDDLLHHLLPPPEGERWPPIHSAFLCPEVPFTFELARAAPPPLPRQAPAPG